MKTEGMETYPGYVDRAVEEATELRTDVQIETS